MGDLLTFNPGRRRVSCPVCGDMTPAADLVSVEFGDTELLVCSDCRERSGGTLLLQVLAGKRELPE